MARTHLFGRYQSFFWTFKSHSTVTQQVREPRTKSNYSKFQPVSLETWVIKSFTATCQSKRQSVVMYHQSADHRQGGNIFSQSVGVAYLSCSLRELGGRCIHSYG